MLGLQYHVYSKHCRDSGRGDWVTYEDLIQNHQDLLPEDDSVVKVVMDKGELKERLIIGFNGQVTLCPET